MARHGRQMRFPAAARSTLAIVVFTSGCRPAPRLAARLRQAGEHELLGRSVSPFCAPPQQPAPARSRPRSPCRWRPRRPSPPDHWHRPALRCRPRICTSAPASSMSASPTGTARPACGAPDRLLAAVASAVPPRLGFACSQPGWPPLAIACDLLPALEPASPRPAAVAVRFLPAAPQSRRPRCHHRSLRPAIPRPARLPPLRPQSAAAIPRLCSSLVCPAQHFVDLRHCLARPRQRLACARTCSRFPPGGVGYPAHRAERRTCPATDSAASSSAVSVSASLLRSTAPSSFDAAVEILGDDQRRPLVEPRALPLGAALLRQAAPRSRRQTSPSPPCP